jgi:LmbE family N-acetylglucosaminyl deacetylase
MAEKLRIMIVGAHPDDCEVHFAGMAALYAEREHKVVMVSMTDGRCGHFSIKPAALAKRRLIEARNAAKAVGAKSKVMPFPDTQLFPDLRTRLRLLREVRTFAPDVILTHQMEDYHPDHRATVELVYDISYLTRVPQALPGVKVMSHAPVIVQSARGLRTHGDKERIICVPIDKVWKKKFVAMAAHESQFFEWLAWEQGDLKNVPRGREARLKYLENWRGPHYAKVAEWAKKKVKGRKGKDFRYAEAVYPARAGRGLNPELIEKLFPFPKLVIGF